MVLVEGAFLFENEFSHNLIKLKPQKNKDPFILDIDAQRHSFKPFISISSILHFALSDTTFCLKNV